MARLSESRPLAALLFTLFGAGLLASSFLAAETWSVVDTAVFRFFNDKLVPGSPWVAFIAYVNKRVFDVAALACMGLLYTWYFLRQDNGGKRFMIGLGICMLLAGIVIKQCGDLLPIAHPSPTLAFEDANRLTRLTDIATKDSARNSFPGDHGMMLMIFSAFIARYFGLRAFCLAAVITVAFSMPRIMAGAHWFSDIFMGSLAITCICMSWFLLTPASDRAAALIGRWLPRFLFATGEPIRMAGR